MSLGAFTRSVGLCSMSLALVTLSACTTTATRSYELPAEQVSLAAQEAVLSVGYPGSGLASQRALMFGLFLGDGGEQVQVDIVPAGSRTDVTVTSRKQFVGFLAQQHYAVRIAEAIDRYLAENQPLWARAASKP